MNEMIWNHWYPFFFISSKKISQFNSNSARLRTVQNRRLKFFNDTQFAVRCSSWVNEHKKEISRTRSTIFTIWFWFLLSCSVEEHEFSKSRDFFHNIFWKKPVVVLLGVWGISCACLENLNFRHKLNQLIVGIVCASSSVREIFLI